MCNVFKALDRAFGTSLEDAPAPAPAPAPVPVAPVAAAPVIKVPTVAEKAQEAAADNAKRDARRRGRSSTILTGGLGDAGFGQSVSPAGLSASSATYLGG